MNASKNEGASPYSGVSAKSPPNTSGSKALISSWVVNPCNALTKEVFRSIASFFCAATYLRGIDFIQIPTTLLAQVDSSVGGKTAINIKQGKNLVGSFYNPIQVLISTKYLESLPDHEYKSGMGEVVKYALIGNKKLNNYMQLNSDAIKKKRLNALEHIIEESIKSKAKIVTSDEKEKGIRAILNFGHTFGHAIEAFEKYKGITHGAAVTLGMIIAGKISFYEGHIRSHQLDNMINLIESLGLNTNYSKYKRY